MESLTHSRWDEVMTKSLFVTAVTLTGLSAGLFTSFSIAVMPGLRRTGDAAFVEGMRGINVAILNPAFALIFGGAFFAAAAALVVGWNDVARPWFIAGIALYVVGAFVMTFAVNVPLNDALEAGKGSASSLREAFEDKWVAWNYARSIFTTSALVCMLIGTVRAS